MWKYIDNKTINTYLLSLFYFNDKSDNEIIREIYSISNKVESNYKKFKISKRSGGYRTIYEPNYTLKFLQKQILDKILSKMEISKYAKAYKKNISLIDNAKPHINKKIILKLDIESFFDNITFLNIYKKCFSSNLYPKQIGTLLTSLVTYNDYLPQGAPTSAYISNLVMRDFDEIVGNWCSNKNIDYTRYSDDMTFSGDFIVGEVISFVRKNLYKLGLKLNNKKIHVVTQTSSQNVTGIVVNKKLQVPSKYRKRIRQEIYFIKKFGLESHLRKINMLDKEKYLSSLYGKILYVLQINKEDNEFRKYKKYIKSLL